MGNNPHIGSDFGEWCDKAEAFEAGYQAGLEEAAKVCEETKTLSDFWDKNEMEYPRHVGVKLARAIRSLAEEKKC